MSTNSRLTSSARFCRDELNEEPGVALQNLGPADVKTLFGWTEKNFKGSVTADSSLSNYWRVLKGLYYDKTWKTLDENVLKDCLNVTNVNTAYVLVSFFG